MPQVTFPVAASGDDGFSLAEDAAYPPSYDANNTADQWLWATKEDVGATYKVYCAFLKFNTSTLPDDIVIDSVQLRVYVGPIGNADSRNLVADDFNWGATIDSGDHSAAVGSGVYNGSIGALTANAYNTLTLALAPNLSSTTYLRFGISGSTPAGSNYVGIGSYNHATVDEPRLIVTYHHEASGNLATTVAATCNAQVTRYAEGSLNTTVTASVNAVRYVLASGSLDTLVTASVNANVLMTISVGALVSVAAAVAAAAHSSAYRAGWAIEVTLPGGLFWRWTTIPGGVTIESNAFSHEVWGIEGGLTYGDPALSDLTVIAGNALDVVTDQVRGAGLHLAPVRVWELLTADVGLPLTPELWFEGAVDSSGPADEAWARLKLGALLQEWGLVVPPTISAVCRYTSTSQCPYVAACNHQYAAGTPNCTTNAQTDRFGGFRHLPVEGTVLEFRDAGVSLAAGDAR